MRMRNPLCWQLSFKLLVAVYLYSFLKGTTLCSQGRNQTYSMLFESYYPPPKVKECLRTFGSLDSGVHHNRQFASNQFRHLTIFNISNNFFLSYLQYTKSLSDLQIFFKFPFKTTCGFLFA